MRENFLDFKEYYKQAIVKVPNDSFFKGSIDHKFRHSVAVLYAGERIIKETPELKNTSESFRKLAKTALLFHDVGRFEEAVKRHNTPNLTAKAEVLNQYDHGLLGYNALKDNPKYNDIRIVLAVRYHGKMMDEVRKSSLWQKTQACPEGKEAQEILYLVRDADKLANLENIKKEDHLRKDLFYKLLSKEALQAGLSEKVKEQFLSGQTVLSPTVYSFADRVLMILSWIFDLNYQKTKEIFKENKYDEYLLDLLAQYHQKQTDIMSIRKKMIKNLLKN
ncbi:MAG: HD domain-containing protein [Alphaproteobacteria bacterium]|nr:HD domain-containing protein [Alphaproteobacteria bacterium]